MKLDSTKIIPPIWTLAVLLYLLRTIADPLKYLFIASFVVLLIFYSYFIITDNKKPKIKRFLSVTKEYHLLGLFLASGILLSTQIEVLSIKSIINFLGITIFYLIFFEYKNQIQLLNLLKGWLILTLVIGVLGLLKWLNFLFDINFSLFSIFYSPGSSLVSEYNFYACYYIISAIIYFYSLHKKLVHNNLFVNLPIIILFLWNIALSGSRRGLILLAICIIAAIIYLITKRKHKHRILYKNLFYLNAIFCSILIIFLILIPFRSKIVTEKDSQSKIAATLFRYSKIFSPGITYSRHYDMLWPKTFEYKNDRTNWKKYTTYNNFVEDKEMARYQNMKNEFWHKFDKKAHSENLLYNGDFKYGNRFWGINAPDSIKHEIINTKFGNALRVSRHEGNGYWPLKYIGREIIYYKGVSYTYRFKYRVIKGRGVPFKIGWWINEGDGYKNDLTGNIKKLDQEWFEFSASYKFKGDHRNLQTFMNSQQANSVVDFADIELSCDDTLNKPKYLDQLLQLEGYNLFYNSNFEHGTKFWGSDTPDTIKHELIGSEFGKTLRVTRKNGKGFWPLAYQGRNIYYYKDLTYYFRFKYRVIQGSETPFNIGWWVQDTEQKQHNLRKNVFPLNDDWFECIASYKFEKDYYGRTKIFMNSQEANTIIDFTDIELICDDTLNRPMYADEKIEEIKMLEESKKGQHYGYEKKKLLSERTVRWIYAFELWTSEYSWINKLFGKGFDYLDIFGQKFYPDEDRIDYPHNPILSAFLYSGLLGGFFYIYFLVLSFYYYWKYRKNHMLFFILFLVTFVFVFISSNSHFNVPIFAMLSLVPFITRSIAIEKAKGRS